MTLYTTPKFNSSPLKMDGWKTILSYWGPVSFQGRTVKLRGGTASPIFTISQSTNPCETRGFIMPHPKRMKLKHSGHNASKPVLDKAVCRGRCLILPDGKGVDGSLEAEYFQNDLIDWNHLTFKFHVSIFYTPKKLAWNLNREEETLFGNHDLRVSFTRQCIVL